MLYLLACLLRVWKLNCLTSAGAFSLCQRHIIVENFSVFLLKAYLLSACSAPWQQANGSSISHFFFFYTFCHWSDLLISSQHKSSPSSGRNTVGCFLWCHLRSTHDIPHLRCILYAHVFFKGQHLFTNCSICSNLCVTLLPAMLGRSMLLFFLKHLKMYLHDAFRRVG